MGISHLFLGKGEGCFVFYALSVYSIRLGGEVLPSEKILQQKKALVSEITEKLKSSCAGVLVSYKGINVSDDTKLRKELREAGVDYFVVKNTLLQRAADQAELKGMEEFLEGTTAIAISPDDHVAAAKILCKFSEDNEFFKIKTGFIDGSLISEAEVKALAKLPSKEILVAKALAGMNAPLSGFVCVLNGTIRSLVIALDAIATKKQSA